jgi:N-glycosylase/DNA lyase
MKLFQQLPVPKPVGHKDMSLKELITHYRKIRPAIKRRISEFQSIIAGGDDDEIFSELCFCILTANANAAKCYEAIKELRELGLLTDGSACSIRPKLKGRARFHNKKADYIVGARKLFKAGSCLNIRGALDVENIIDTRDRFVKRVKGYGYKEASHFLRNIGLGGNIAILDRHVLKNLKRYGVIDKIPLSVGARKVYIEIEDKMRLFSKDVGIPMDELDLLFWSMQTGYIFK